MPYMDRDTPFPGEGCLPNRIGILLESQSKLALIVFGISLGASHVHPRTMASLRHTRLGGVDVLTSSPATVWDFNGRQSVNGYI